MTGPDHYTAAEQLIADIEELTSKTQQAEDAGLVMSPAMIETVRSSVALTAARAQVHATLALAAATAMAANTPGGQMEARDFRAWDNVAGVQ